MDKKTTFLFSALVAILFYVLLVASFVLYIQKEKVKKYKNNASQTALEISIITKPKEKITQKQSAKSSPKKVEQTIVKKSASKKAKKTSDLKSLFKDVSTKANKVVDKKVNKTKANQVESRFKSKFQREKKNDKVELSKLIDVKNTDSYNSKNTLSQNTIGEKDKYYSMISDMILRRWYNYPLLNNQNYTVKVKITIDTQGNFSYHIVSLSGIDNVDVAIKDFLNNQKFEKYPVSPDNKKKNIQINFKPDQNN